MSANIATTFAELKREGRGGLIAYLTAGDPDVDRSVALLESVAAAGADVLEVGVPFSDPLADGPVIQRAVERALAGGTNLRTTLDIVQRVRRRVKTPIVLFTYGNPILRMGVSEFTKAAVASGADAVLILDYPVEESGALRQAIIGAGLDPIFLISPTTSDDRIRQTAAQASGFLYLISRLGVTGARDRLPAEAAALAARVRARTSLPLALGFGISTPEQVAEACRAVDAAVVGSALVDIVARHAAAADLCDRAGQYVQWLKSAI